MQLHQLKPRTPRYKYPRVGRGGKRGKTAGKGTKGQKARAGRKMRPELRDIIKKFPKLRGYRFGSTVLKPSTLEVGALAQFSAGTAINPVFLVEQKLVRRVGGKVPPVKILAGGELTVALAISDITVSASAREMITKAGGTIAEMKSKTTQKEVPVSVPKAPTEKKKSEKAVVPKSKK